MTEADWLSCTDPGPMLEYLTGKASERKLRLFAVACVKRVERFLREKEGRQAFKFAERLIEGPVSKPQIRRVYYKAGNAYWKLIDQPGQGNGCPYTAALLAASDALAHPWLELSPLATCFVSHFHEAACAASFALANADASPSSAEGSPWHLAVRAELKGQTALLRDISGNPFRPVALCPSWLTPNVTGLATTIYEDLVFDRMPILADALEEAGCDNADILTHCRGPGPHVRGCWVLDLLTGRG
jgi:hypothetical protein